MHAACHLMRCKACLWITSIRCVATMVSSQSVWLHYCKEPYGGNGVQVADINPGSSAASPTGPLLLPTRRICGSFPAEMSTTHSIPSARTYNVLNHGNPSWKALTLVSFLIILGIFSMFSDGCPSSSLERYHHAACTWINYKAHAIVPTEYIRGIPNTCVQLLIP